MRSHKTWMDGLLAAAVMLPLGSPVGAAGLPNWLPGVNLSGGEYNGGSTRIYYDYTYPTKAEIDYFSGKGMRVFRLPLISSRVLSQSIAINNGGPDWQAVMGVINEAAADNAYVIIDIHQFGSMPAGLVGQNAAATTQFVAAWAELAKRLKGSPNVIFGLMNEPNQQTAAQWLTGVNAALAAIRQAGATQLALVPGSYWDGAWSWTNTDNATVMLGVQDPGNNYAIEVHQYLDQYSSGTTSSVVPGAGKTDLVAFTNWARQHKLKAFLGEFGFATDTASMTEGGNLLGYMANNTDVWRGWTYWAGGPWWGNYMFSAEPANGVDKPQMALLVKYAAPASTSATATPAANAQTTPTPGTPSKATTPAVTGRATGYTAPANLLSLIGVPKQTDVRTR
jgi:endoglucanase